MGVVVTEVLHFVILMIGSAAFMFIAVAQHGGWHAVLERIATTRPEALKTIPPIASASAANSIEVTTIILLALQGFFFAGSPTAGEGSTAQRFMAAPTRPMRWRASCSIASWRLRSASCRSLALAWALSLFWPASLAAKAPAPSGMIVLDDPVHTWAELIRTVSTARRFRRFVTSVEVAAYTSTLPALINWGGSFVDERSVSATRFTAAPIGREIWVSRITTLLLFVAASVVAILFVKQMVGWFMFINSAMVIFLLPLAVFRFFWWRFNVWGELAAIVLGLPLSIFVWFVLDFQNSDVHPMWHGLGILFLLSFVVLIAVTLVTPPESPETLKRFYERCRPPGFWGPVRSMDVSDFKVQSARSLLVSSVLGIFACLSLVLATNALFVSSWPTFVTYFCVSIGFSAALIVRVLKNPSSSAETIGGLSAARFSRLQPCKLVCLCGPLRSWQISKSLMPT